MNDTALETSFAHSLELTFAHFLFVTTTIERPSLSSSHEENNLHEVILAVWTPSVGPLVYDDVSAC
jgi:hypothetical protein